MINIPSTIVDPAYRYQMPQMDIKFEGKHSGTKTCIVNLEEVAKAIRVPGEFIIRYMCIELGISKEKSNIIKGKHDYCKLLILLNSFIQKYVLCHFCKLPEIDLLTEERVLKSKCRVCSNTSKLDNHHKIAKYIVRNIPISMSEIVISDDILLCNNEMNEEEEKKEEVEEEVVTAESEHILQAVESIKEYIKDKGDSLKLSKLKDEIHNQCISARATQDLKHFIVFNGLFSINILKEFPKYKDLLKSVVAADKKDGAKAFIMTMVKFFIEKHPKLEVAIPTFLHHVYEAEIVDESVFLKWEAKKFKTDKMSSLYSKKNESTFKKKAEKFFTWLKEAVEDEEDNENEGLTDQ